MKLYILKGCLSFPHLREGTAFKEKTSCSLFARIKNGGQCLHGGKFFELIAPYSKDMKEVANIKKEFIEIILDIGNRAVFSFLNYKYKKWF